MVDWNPNSTATKGLEWMPARSGVTTLDALSKVAATSFVQTSGVSMSGVRVPITALPTRGGLFVVEVYDNETGVPGAITSLEAIPNEDVSGGGTGSGGWRNQAGTAATAGVGAGVIDEGSAAVSTADYIKNYNTGAGSGGQTAYYGRMNTAALSLTGKRIVSVALNVHINSAEYVTVWAGLNIGGVDFVTTQPTYYNNFIGLIQSTPLYYNPSTKLPWTIADVQAFDSTDEWWCGSTAGTKTMRIHAAWLTIQIVDENRIAIGKLDDTASALTTGWNTVTLTLPTGSGAWVKDGSGSHLYTVRRISSVGAITLPYLEAADTFAAANGWTPTVNTTTGLFTAMGSATKRLTPFISRITAGPADGVDSLPYYQQVDAEVYTGRKAEQEFTAAALTYGLLRFLVKNTGTTADLLVKAMTGGNGGGAQVGGTATLTAAAFNALPEIVNGIKQVDIQLASGALLSAVQHHIEFSSTAASSSACWVIVALDTLDAGNTAGYGSTTDLASVDGAEANRYDIPVTLSTVPTTPTGLAAVAQTQALDGQTICGVTTIPRTHLSWNTTALGGSFGYYKIDRTEDGGTTWSTIAQVEVEATVTFDDYESLFGVTSGYRIRVYKSNGAASDWSSTVNLAKATPACASLYMVSNYDPAYNVAYDYAPSKGWDFNEADDLQTVAVYGRDNVLGFLPLEHRGATANLTIKLGVDDRVPLGGSLGLDAFAPLRAIAHAPLPYVCLLDHYGVRMYAALRVPSGVNEEPAGLYFADFAAIQVTDEPFVA